MLQKSGRNRGYLRLRHSQYRGWYLHRAVIDLLIKEWNPWGWTGIPEGWEVHHINRDRADCQPWNLILMEPALHHSFQRACRRCPYTGKFIESAPEIEFDPEYIKELTES